MDDQRRLVSFASARHWREIWRIGFNQDAIAGRLSGGSLNVQRLRKSEDATETQVEAKIQGLPSLRRSAREAMHDAADSMRRPMLGQQGQRVRPSLARMNNDRFQSARGDDHLLDEDGFLRVACREVVMIVETDLA